MDLPERILATLQSAGGAPLDKQELAERIGGATTAKEVNRALYEMHKAGAVVQHAEMHGMKPTWVRGAAAVTEKQSSSPEAEASKGALGDAGKASDHSDNMSSEDEPLSSRRRAADSGGPAPEHAAPPLA